MKLSVIFITKNEEEMIKGAIQSIKDIAGEIIVLDSYSQDSTRKNAVGEGAKVYSHHFKNFADQRNAAASFAKGEWMLYLDADEVATQEFKKEVIEKITENEKNGYFIKRKTYFYGQDWGYTDQVQRLFKKDAFVEWKGEVHETPRIKGEFGVVENPVKHYTHRDITQMVEKTNEWSEYEAALRMKANHPPMSPLRFLRVMATAFADSYIKQKGYRNKTAGLIEAIYQSFSMFITYAKLWEMQQRKNDSIK